MQFLNVNLENFQMLPPVSKENVQLIKALFYSLKLHKKIIPHVLVWLLSSGCLSSHKLCATVSYLLPLKLIR